MRMFWKSCTENLEQLRKKYLVKFWYKTESSTADTFSEVLRKESFANFENSEK